MSDYRVLARAYRPQSFEDLVGQDVLVRTLTNAFESGRIAHAFLLTGIRGIGKTTTARIIAKAMNCIGTDGQGDKPTIAPCGECANCLQIRDDRHVDVLEMDAASHTGVGDIREIIDSARYKPSSARYKVYIIDEVHMLSNSAFNALLKTLEEPPAHVIFILATTEIRKIPVTILSRCQRFDLRRLDNEAMGEHLHNVAQKERVDITQDALELIAIASEGSVRDALSLLDQAIAHSDRKEDGTFHISDAMVRRLLGLVDRTRLYRMVEHLFAGQCEEAIALLQEQYRDGANMVALVQDMMQAVHMISRLLVVQGYELDKTFSDHERQMLSTLAAKLRVSSVSKAWQLLLKGLDEMKRAPDALAATEMLFIRFAYASNLPDPDDLIKKWKQAEHTPATAPAVPSPSGGSAPMLSLTTHNHALAVQPQTEPVAASHLSLVANKEHATIASFDDIMRLCEQEKEAILLHKLREGVCLVGCDASTLRIGTLSTLEPSVQSQLCAFLKKHTGTHWRVEQVDEPGQVSIYQQQTDYKARRMEEAKKSPIVSAILESFADSAIVDIENLRKV